MRNYKFNCDRVTHDARTQRNNRETVEWHTRYSNLTSAYFLMVNLVSGTALLRNVLRSLINCNRRGVERRGEERAVSGQCDNENISSSRLLSWMVLTCLIDLNMSMPFFSTNRCVSPNFVSASLASAWGSRTPISESMSPNSVFHEHRVKLI